MPIFKFDKLVRDKIVEDQLASGAKPKYRQLNDQEHKAELVKKIVEESKEILEASQEGVAAELADIQQALDDLTEKFGVSPRDVAAAQAAKNERKGAFRKGLYVDTINVDEDHEWVPYFRKHADRYPELD